VGVGLLESLGVDLQREWDVEGLNFSGVVRWFTEKA